MLSGKLRRILITALILFALVGLYALAGFAGLPRLLRSELQDYTQKNYHRALALGEIRFNPFTLELEIRDLALPDADGAPLLSFKRLFVNLDIASLWRRGPSFAEISLDAPYTRVVIRKGGALNLADLAPASSTPERRPGESSSPLRLYIGTLAIRDGRARFEDDTRPKPFRAELQPIGFTLHDFSTVAQAQTGNRYALTGASDLGEKFSWSGDIHLDPLASSGRFELDDVHVRTLWSYAADSLPFEIVSGMLGLKGDYDLRTTSAGPGVRATVHELQVKALGARPKGAPENLVDIPDIEVREAVLDADRHSVDVGKVRIADAAVRAQLDEKGRLNLLEMSGPAPAETSASAASPVSAEPPAAPAPAAAPPWVVSAPDLEISGLKISAKDHQVTPAAAFSVSDLNLHVGGFTTAPGATLKVDAKARINENGALEASGNVTPDSGAVDAALSLAKLDLVAFQPYLSKQTQLRLLSGVFGANVKLSRAHDTSTSVEGEIDLSRLRTVDTLMHTDFVKWDRLRVQEINYRAPPPGSGRPSVRIGKVLADGLYARVIIARDHTVNVSDVLQPPGTPRSPDAADKPDSSPDARKNRKATAAAKAAAKTAASKTSAGKNAPAPPAPEAAPPPIDMSIGTVRVTNGSANFADLSIEPRFAIGIQTLNGSVSGLSSDPRSRAKVLLDGKVDRYAPAHIEGEVNVLSAATFSDIRMSFKGIEMTTATPYSGHFAGYKIEKGKLTADLNYKIDARKLDARHRIVIDQLQLGERVESPDAVHLPLKIAVALLKDRNGVIDLDLPITGSLDDPQFKVGPIIWKAVINLLTKIVTAPFALLGSLFGGGEEMNHIDFAPGSAALDPMATERLGSLVKALQERPQLQLDVPIAYSSELDGPAIRAQHLERALTEQRRTENAGKRGGKPRAEDAAPTAAPQDPAEHYRLLVAVHRARIGKDAPLPVEAQTVEADRKAKSDPEKLRSAITALENALCAAMQVTDDDLQGLGKQRSAAIQDALLAAGTIEPTRVFVITAPSKAADGKVVRAELSLK